MIYYIRVKCCTRILNLHSLNKWALSLFFDIIRLMERIKYEIDPHNRLVIVKRVRRVLDGRFKVDHANNLIYHVKAPLQGDTGSPNQLMLKGSWSLNNDHTLVFTLDKWARQTFGDQLMLQADLLDAKANSIAFAVTTRGGGAGSTYILELGGAWQADDRNRLSFRVKRERSRYDILTLEGAWEIGKNHEIVYKHESSCLIRNKRRVHTLTLKGHWDITGKRRISYILDAEAGNSAFDFKTGLGVFEGGRIKYEIGIGMAKRLKPLRRILTLFGSWRIKKDIGLSFDVEAARGRIYTIAFGADVRMMGDGTLSFKLRDILEDNELGITVELSRRILKGDGGIFLEFLKSKGGEAAIMAGAAWRW